MERETIRVSLPSFWTGASTQDIHKITESPNFNTQATEHPSDNLLRRPVTNRVELSGNLHGTGHSYFPFPPVRPHGKLEEVYSGTPDEIRISRDNYRQQFHDTISVGDKGKKPDLCVSRNIDFTADKPKELSIFNWKIESYCPSYNSNTLTNKVPSTVPYTGSTTEPIFRITDNSEQRLCHGTGVVENKFTFDERETHSYCTTSNDNQPGCSQNRGLGGCITGDFNRGELGTGREPTAHQHSGANSSRTGYQNLYKRERGLFDSHSNRQHSSLMLFNKNGGGGAKSMELNMISKRIWLYLLEREITLTAEWIPTHLNVTADRESRNVNDSSEWKLNTNIFHRLIGGNQK